jgi:hypothetical protein
VLESVAAVWEKSIQACTIVGTDQVLCSLYNRLTWMHRPTISTYHTAQETILPTLPTLSLLCIAYSDLTQLPATLILPSLSTNNHLHLFANTRQPYGLPASLRDSINVLLPCTPSCQFDVLYEKTSCDMACRLAGSLRALRIVLAALFTYCCNTQSNGIDQESKRDKRQ